MIIDPKTNKPTRPQLSDQELLKILGAHKARIGDLMNRSDELHRTVIQVGFYIEYLYSEMTRILSDVSKETGKEYKINLEGFVPFANQKFQELQEAATKQVKEQLAADGHPVIDLDTE